MASEIPLNTTFDTIVDYFVRRETACWAGYIAEDYASLHAGEPAHIALRNAHSRIVTQLWEAYDVGWTALVNESKRLNQVEQLLQNMFHMNLIEA